MTAWLAEMMASSLAWRPGVMTPQGGVANTCLLMARLLGAQGPPQAATPS